MTSTLNITETTWPPSYRIRRSARARNVLLQVTTEQQLEIVIPEKKRNINIQEVLEENRRWIEKILKKTNATPREKATIALPNTINCPAVREIWNVIYEPTYLAKRITLFEREGSEKTLVLMGNTHDISLCRKILTRWIWQHAKKHLSTWLHELSVSTGFAYNRVIVRRQATLWGSCNAHNNISLNYKLLFLPKALTQHILLHELCHTQFLDHSTRFWRLLEKVDIDFTQNKLQLKTADRYVPGWLIS